MAFGRTFTTYGGKTRPYKFQVLGKNCDVVNPFYLCEFEEEVDDSDINKCQTTGVDICTSDTDTNDCDGITCNSNGWCIDHLDAYTCICEAGYAGTECDIECPQNCDTCETNSKCSECVIGYMIEVNSPTESVCVQCPENCDICETSTKCSACAKGYMVQVNTPTESVCVECPENCDTCTTTDKCSECANGWTINEASPTQWDCVDLDECTSDPCQNDATCNNGLNEFTCDCDTGYDGVRCDFECPTNCVTCETDTKCSECATGYDLQENSADESVCVKIISCDEYPCHNGGSCTDKLDGSGNYCDCDSEWEGVTCRQKNKKIKDGKNYWYVSGDGTWLEFLEVCHMYGGTLAAFPTESTEQEVRFVVSGRVPGFIGLSSAVAKGIWRWTDTSTTITYNRFDSVLGEPNSEDKTYIYADITFWSAISRDDVKTGAWCMERDSEVACDDMIRGCLTLMDTFAVQTDSDIANGTVKLDVVDETECEAVCRYSNGLFCTWYYFEDSTCTLGEGTPNAGIHSIQVRSIADTTEGRCLGVHTPEDPFQSWLDSDSCTLANIDSEAMYNLWAAVLQNEASDVYIGLYSESLSNWRFASGASPTFTKWNSLQGYPTGAIAPDRMCVKWAQATKEYEITSCDTILYAACETPAKTFRCNDAPTLTTASKEVIQEAENGFTVTKVRYTCTDAHAVFDGYSPQTTYEELCPCDGFVVRNHCTRMCRL